MIQVRSLSGLRQIRRNLGATLVPGVLAAAALVQPGDKLSADAPPDYAAKIAPILQEHCIDCHAADDPEGEFVTESFAGVMKGGKAGPAVEPGKASESLLVKFLEGRSGKEGKNKFMPPGKRAHLRPEEVALIRAWIDAGARPPAAEAKPADVLARLPKVKPIEARRSALHAAAYSPAARMFAVGAYGSVQLIDAATRQPMRKLEGMAGKVNALVFSPDGLQIFAAAGDAGLTGTAYQWKLADGSLVRTFEGHRDALYALALSPDGKLLATGSYDQKIKLWSTEDAHEVRTLSGHTGAVFGLSFRPDGKVLASASADRTVKLWNTETGQRLDTFSQPLKEQNTVAFSPDGKMLAAGGADNRIRVWSISEAALEGTNPLMGTRYAHEGAVLQVAYSPDGRRLLSSAADRTVKVWSAAEVTELQVLEPQPDWPPALAVAPPHTLAVGRLDGTVGFYDLESGKPLPTAAAAAAKPVPLPEVLRLTPRGLQSGATTKVMVEGKGLNGLQEVRFSKQGVSAKIGPVNPAGTKVELTISAEASIPRGEVEAVLVTKAGPAMPKKLLVDYLPQIVRGKSAEPLRLPQMPVNVWGVLAETGQLDSCRFRAEAGQTIVFDLTAKRLESKVQAPRLEVLGADGQLLEGNNGLDSGGDPFLAFTAPAAGEYVVRVREVTLEGSSDHAYRLTAGALPCVTGWWPLSIPANTETPIHLVGPNLHDRTLPAKAGAEGEIILPMDGDGYRSRVPMRVVVSGMPEVLEQEPNDSLETAQSLTIPQSVNGRLFNAAAPSASDVDLYRFDAEKGETLVLETRAAMLGSPVDTKIEVLDAAGAPVPQLLLQATKDSWLTLRSKDAKEPGIRLGQFSEMELNDYMYFNGEILKIFRLARGPDADTLFYMRNGVRRAWFSTSPAAHGLDEPCYVVEPHPPGSRLVPNGLPVFTVYYANDDDAERELGRDSRLLFTAPAAGRYFVRVSDTRGWGGERFAYRLIVRRAAPDFSAAIVAKGMDQLPAGSGMQFLVKGERMDGFEGDLRVDFANVPEGFFVSPSLVIQAGHLTAAGCLFALPGAKPGPADFSKVTVTVSSTLQGMPATRSAGAFPSVAVVAAPKQLVFMEPDLNGKPAGDGKSPPAKPYEVTVTPGGRVSVWLRVDRRGNDGLLGLDVENLPHGVIVDSIGLNGVEIRANEFEREIFLSCAKWVPEQDRLCQVVLNRATGNEPVAGVQAGFPVLLKVRPTEHPLAAAQEGR